MDLILKISKTLQVSTKITPVKTGREKLFFYKIMALID